VSKKRLLSEEIEKVKIINTTKPGKENSTEDSKFRPINLINLGGKVLEKILINRIMHHVYTNNLMNQNQFCFTSKEKAKDTALAVKKYTGCFTTYGHNCRR